MNHDEYRELAALGLYSELAPAEAARLEAHRAECAECRRFQAELEASLGALARDASTDERFEATFRRTTAALEALPEREPARIPRPWVDRRSLVAFAAGLLAAWLLFRIGAEPESVPGSHSTAMGGDSPARVASAFARTEPPPPATPSGPFSILASARGR